MADFSRLFALTFALIATLSACSAGSAEDQPSGIPIAYEGGDITEAQYRAVVAAARQCMMDLGYQVSEIEKRADGLTYTFRIEGGTVGNTDSADDYDACVWKYNLPAAEVAFQEQNTVTGAEREELFAEFTTCLEEAGVPGITDSDTQQSISERILQLEESGEDASAAMTCMTDYGGRIYGPNI